MEHSPTPSHESAPPAHSHGHHDDHAHVTAHRNMYLAVGGFLMVMTAVTVWLSYIDFGSSRINIVVAMIVATIKASAVAAIFMHLKGERITIWRFLIFTAFFVTGLLRSLLPLVGSHHGQFSHPSLIPLGCAPTVWPLSISLRLSWVPALPDSLLIPAHVP